MLSLLLTCCFHIFTPLPVDVYISPFTARVWAGDHEQAESKAAYQQLRAKDRRDTGDYSQFHVLEKEFPGVSQNVECCQ